MIIRLNTGVMNPYAIIVDRSKGTLEVNGKVFSKVEMREAVDAYKGSNRIHKPIAILFYTDSMNGSLKSLKDCYGEDAVSEVVDAELVYKCLTIKKGKPVTSLNLDSGNHEFAYYETDIYIDGEFKGSSNNSYEATMKNFENMDDNYKEALDILIESESVSEVRR